MLENYKDLFVLEETKEDEYYSWINGLLDELIN